MATTQNLYTGDGSTTNYSFTFEYLKQSDVKVTLDTVATTAFTFANATTLSFTTAPANGVAIRIFRDTAIDTLSSTFFPGSAIKAEDLNQNFTQSLYVTQESETDVGISDATANAAKTTAEGAVTTANSAVTTANSAVTTANNAVTTANSAVTTANTADTNASAAVTTANAASATATTASTDAASAVTTANTASTNASAAVTTANSAATDAATAITTANGAVTTANSATTAAAAAQTTANNAVTTANGAVTTANTASTNASAAVTTANTANTNASAAVVTANAAAASVSSAVLFELVANVAAIPGSPADQDYVEVADSTGIESFSPLSGVPAGFTGASGLTVRIRYDSSASSWVYMSYFANDSEDRYLTKNIPVVTGDSTNGSGQITLNCETNSHGIKIKGPPHSAAATYTLTLPNDAGSNGQSLTTNGSGTLTWTTQATDSISEGNTSAEVIDTGTDGRFVVTTEGSERLRVDSSGRMLVGTSSASGYASSRMIITGAGTDATGSGNLVLQVGQANGSITANEQIGTINFGDTSGYSYANISASADFAAGSDSPGRLVFSTTADGASAPTERLRIDSSGNVGIGQASPASLLEIKSDGTAINEARFCINEKYNSGSTEFGIDFKRTYDTGGDNQDAGYIRVLRSGGANNAGLVFGVGNRSGVSERMRIDSSGRLLVGTSTSRAVAGVQWNQQVEGTGNVGVSVVSNSASASTSYLILGKSRGASIGSNTIVNNGDPLGIIFFNGADGNDLGTAGASVKAEVDGTPGANDMPGRLVFSTTADGASSPTERMRIDSSGRLGVGFSSPPATFSVHALATEETTAYFKSGTSNVYLQLANSVNSQAYIGYESTNLVFYANSAKWMGISSGGQISGYSATGWDGFSSAMQDAAGTTRRAFLGRYGATATDTGTVSFAVYTNGNVQNTNNSYGALSDIKLKENIVDASSQWDDIKALRPVNYNFKEGQVHTQLGLIAQEVELVSPGLVSESPDRDEDGNDLGTVTKSVNYSVLYMKAVKALQEAMERIETLEAKVAALEGT